MTDFLATLSQEKKLFSDYLLNFLQQEKTIYQKLSLGQDVFGRLEKFVASGKMARSAILSLTYQSLLPKVDQKIYQEIILPLGSALELIHSGLLIHDDIIDQDAERRGQNSIWRQYCLEVKNSKMAKHYGQSQAICVADLCFYLANQLILRTTANLTAQAGLHAKKAIVINNTINREISRVILAEMLDSQLAVVKATSTLEEINELNLYKTARYTFSLPMVLAGHLANTNQSLIKKIEAIGEEIGLIFQIQDDYLGIFGHKEKTGKPILSDIREGKKTIFYWHLVNQTSLSQNELSLLQNNFGQEKIKIEDEKKLQALFKNKSWPSVEKILKDLNSQTGNLIISIDQAKLKQLLTQVLTFAQHRDH